MTKKRDDEIIALLDAHIRDSVGHLDRTLATEREKVQAYYDGEKPLPQHRGDATYVSQDVYNAVEGVKANLLETFGGSHDLIEFEPQGPEDVAMARQATEFTDFVVFRQNPGYRIFHDVIHDSLTARLGVVQIYWDAATEERTETFEQASADQLAAALSDADDIVDFTIDRDEGGMLAGTLTRRISRAQCRIENVPPEEFLLRAGERDANERGVFKGRRTRKTRAQLKAEGFPARLIDDLPADGGDWDVAAETMERHRATGAWPFGDDMPGDADTARLWVYDCYLTANLDATRPKLWNIVVSGRSVLRCEQVADDPFVACNLLRRPHAAFGSSYADKVVAVQNAKTVLTRSILNHAAVTNNPRFVVVKGGLVNPRELIDNRFGGIVNVTRPDAITPMVQAPLNPYVFETVQLMDADKEDVTGVSRLAQGLNKDAISRQNSAALVGQLTTLSMQRAKVMARNFIEDFLKGLYLKVYAVVIANEDRGRLFDVAGGWNAVSPAEWGGRTKVRASARIGYGEQEKEAQLFLALHGLLAGDPVLSPLYGPGQRQALVAEYLKRFGIKDPSPYLAADPPPPPPAPPPDPAQAIQLETMRAALSQMQIQNQVMLRQQDQVEKMAALNHELSLMRAALDARKQNHKERIDEAEIGLELAEAIQGDGR